MPVEKGPHVKCPKCLYEWDQRAWTERKRSAKICCPNCHYSWIDKRRKKAAQAEGDARLRAAPA